MLQVLTLKLSHHLCRVGRHRLRGQLGHGGGGSGHVANVAGLEGEGGRGGFGRRRRRVIKDLVPMVLESSARKTKMRCKKKTENKTKKMEQKTV